MITLPTCPECGAALLAACNIGRTGKHHAHHGASKGPGPCRLRQATWGFYDSVELLAQAIASGEGLRMASAESLDLVRDHIQHLTFVRSDTLPGIHRQILALLRKVEAMEGAR